MNTRLLTIVVCFGSLVLALPLAGLAQEPSPRSTQAACSSSDWRQVNSDGFGDVYNEIGSLAVFGDQLYAGAWNATTGAQVWRTGNGRTWERMTTTWSISVTAILDAQPFGSYLYFGTNKYDSSQGELGGEIWRTDGTTFEQVVSGGMGNKDRFDMNEFAVFSNTLYVATSRIGGLNEVYRSTSGDVGSWQLVSTPGFGAGGVNTNVVMDVYEGYLYAGIGRSGGFAELWRTSDGTTWMPVFTNGLATSNTDVSSMAEFDGAFYVGLRNVTTGGEVWRSGDGVSFTQVFSNGLGNPSNGRPYGLLVYDERLYLIFSNLSRGAEVWRTLDGNAWECVETGGWGDPYTGYADYFDKAAAVFNGRLYVGTSFNDYRGGQVWEYPSSTVKLFLPILMSSDQF